MRSSRNNLRLKFLTLNLETRANQSDRNQTAAASRVGCRAVIARSVTDRAAQRLREIQHSDPSRVSAGPSQTALFT